jgi:hypothetical protein
MYRICFCCSKRSPLQSRIFSINMNGQLDFRTELNLCNTLVNSGSQLICSVHLGWSLHMRKYKASLPPNLIKTAFARNTNVNCADITNKWPHNQRFLFRITNFFISTSYKVDPILYLDIHI